MKTRTRARGVRALGLSLIVGSVLALGVAEARAYSTYSDGTGGGNCATCHGPFLFGDYVSFVDGQSWHDPLMSGHQNAWLGGFDCFVCHTTIGEGDPVSLDSSSGSGDLPPISCMGCHGREQDIGNDSFSLGRGAGLRQHHWNAGIAICGDCHLDADPGNYTPVAEDFLPAYYAAPDTLFNLPEDPCNPALDYPEDVLGVAGTGLDNDGDGLYDEDDPDCSPLATPPPTPPGDCLCVPTRVSPGGVIAALRNVRPSNTKGASLTRTVTVALKALEDSQGSCPAGATSNPVNVRLELVDDDGDQILDASKPGIVCTSGATTYVKFTARFEGPENCRASEVPTPFSRGEIDATATSDDGSLEVVRSILCRRGSNRD